MVLRPYIVLAIVAASIAGCTGRHAGPLVDYFDWPPESAEYRLESEWVPNAVLMREDTRPVSRLGRFAFAPGDGDLIVLTRVTSSSDAADKSAPGGDDVAIDREFERMWFVVPAGTPDGAALDVETQIAQRLIGYDHREEYSTGYYAKPFGAVGSFAILKRRPDALLIGFNVIVMPKDRRNIVVRGIREVPIATNGLHARPAPAAK